MSQLTRPRVRKAAWLALLVGLAIWSVLQPGAIEPMPWTGTLDS
jgi:hypothetical protein